MFKIVWKRLTAAITTPKNKAIQSNIIKTKWSNQNAASFLFSSLSFIIGALWRGNKEQRAAVLIKIIVEINLGHDGATSNVILSLVDHHKTADDQVAFEFGGALQWPSEITDITVINVAVTAAAGCHSVTVAAPYYERAQLVHHYVNTPASFYQVSWHTIGTSLATNL